MDGAQVRAESPRSIYQSVAEAFCALKAFGPQLASADVCSPGAPEKGEVICLGRVEVGLQRLDEVLARGHAVPEGETTSGLRIVTARMLDARGGPAVGGSLTIGSD